jgi:hypothetical protein
VRSRYMETKLVVGEGQEVGRVHRKVECLVGKSLDEDARRDQHPYFAFRGRLHVRGRRLALAMRQG